MRGTSAEAIERTESSLPEAAEFLLRGNTSAGYLAVKRLADIVCALAGLILLAAPMLILSAIIVIDSPGPAIKSMRQTILADRRRQNAKGGK